MKFFLIILLFVINIFAFEKVYFMPQSSQEAKNEVVKQINEAKKSIDIAMYNLKYRKFVNALGKAASRGVAVKIYYYKKKAKFNKKIKVIKVKDKLHTKIAIFDKKIVIFGSPNWTKKSFKNNYEVMYITDEKNIVKEFNKFIKTIKH